MLPMQTAPYFVLLVAVTALSGCTGARIGSSSYTVLDAALAEATVNQCSRVNPAIEGSWNPSESDIGLLERHLPDLLELPSTACCNPGARLSALDAYHRQYVGVLVGGRRLIYVNAFPVAHAEDTRVPFEVCDGGASFWGVLFDPETAAFSDLAFNGEG